MEFEKTYRLETTIVPTNRVRARQDWTDQVYKTESAKWRAVANETAEIHKKVGRCLSAQHQSRRVLSSLLTEQEIPHNLLNAKPENVERESEIVAQAGRAGAVTTATNMAGRGTDIILGGNSDYMARLKLREVLLCRLVKPDNPNLLCSREVYWLTDSLDVPASTAPRSAESLIPVPSPTTLSKFWVSWPVIWLKLGEIDLSVIELRSASPPPVKRPLPMTRRYRRCALQLLGLRRSTKLWLSRKKPVCARLAVFT